MVWLIVQGEEGIRGALECSGLGDVYKMQDVFCRGGDVVFVFVAWVRLGFG